MIAGGDGYEMQLFFETRIVLRIYTYQSKLQADIAVEELASSFAECANAEAQPGRTESLPFNTGGASPLTIPKFDENSIRAENGRRQTVVDAFQDGSSFICLRCGGLISNLRKDAHLQYWCNSNDSTQWSKAV